MMKCREVMEYLGVGRTTVYELFRRADFPVTRIGRKLMVSEAALAEWCAKGGTMDRDSDQAR